MSPHASKLNPWQRFDAWLGRFAWAPTAEGVLWGLLALLIMVQGWLRGFNLVTFIATFLLAMWLLNALTTFVMRKRLSQLVVQRRLQGLVHAGTPTTITLEVANPSLSGVPGIYLEDEGSAHHIRHVISELPPQAVRVVRHRVVPLQRGYYQWLPLRLASAHPFGLFRRSVTRVTSHAQSIVLPVIGKLDQMEFRRWLRSTQPLVKRTTRERARRSPAPADFYGIREFRAGDSPRWIHWRTTARVGEPMVREFEEPPQQHLLVILEAWLPTPANVLLDRWQGARRENIKQLRSLYKRLGEPTPQEQANRERHFAKREEPFRSALDHLEIAVSLTATLCWTWTRKLGAGFTLAIIDASPQEALWESGSSLRTVMPVLERLAVTEAATQLNPQPLLQRLAGRRFPDGHLLVVSPRATPLAAELGRGLGRTVQLLDVSQGTAKRFFVTTARAILPIHTGSGA